MERDFARKAACRFFRLIFRPGESLVSVTIGKRYPSTLGHILVNLSSALANAAAAAC